MLYWVVKFWVLSTKHMPDLNFIPDFKARGLIQDSTDLQALEGHLTSDSRTVYVGFDPSADSLHIGSLLMLVSLRRIQEAGHRPILVIGGGTGLIGDPTWRQSARTLEKEKVIRDWAKLLKRQVEPFVSFSGENKARMLDNYDWLSKLSVIDFLQGVGKHFPVAPMLAKESMKTRMAGDGISFTELSYMILQAYDFWYLYKNYDCTIQIGGSDQWGNITAGVDYIRRTENQPAFGLTTPLVTKTDGTKFGKTAQGAVWLDADKTSPYAMYQFWLNVSDADAGKYLKYFTFLPLEEIAIVEEETRRAPEARVGQKRLAEEVTRLVHGYTALAEAQRITDVLFSGDVRTLKEKELDTAFRGLEIPVLSGDSASVPDMLVTSRLTESKSRARELVEQGGIEVNGEKVADASALVTRDRALFTKYVIIKRGKKAFGVVQFK